MDIEAAYKRYLKLTGEPNAAATLVVADVLSGKRPAVAGEYMTVAQAAERYSLGKSTIYDAIEAGKLRHSRAGKAIRIKPEDMDAYLEGWESLFD